MPLRVMPHVGRAVLVDHLGVSLRGIVHRIEGDGRHLEVLTEEGSTMAFALNRATATFTAGGSQTGARLRFASATGSPDGGAEPRCDQSQLR
jgi:hypothetical protein